jgi:sugar lactone lactonase YvrE
MLDRFGQTAATPRCVEGYSLETLVGSSRLIGANGVRYGPDGRIFVAQAFGNQISAVDPETGLVEVISPADGAIIAPDDLAFDSHGSLYVTEVMSARVSAIRPGGAVEVVASGTPVANGVTVHQDRIFVSEFRADGRILELSPNGGDPRVIADNVIAPNALSMGPDGHLYFPLVPFGEIWRVSVDGGSPEKVAEGLSIPTSVKFDSDGNLVTVESGSGTVTQIDRTTGKGTRIAQTDFGLDNFTFAPDGGIVVSHFTNGAVTALDRSGGARTIAPGGMSGPFGFAVGVSGDLIVADGMSLATVASSGEVTRPSMLLQHGFPGYVRAVAQASDGALVFTNSAGQVSRYVPGQEATVIASGLDQAMDIEIADDGEIVVADAGAGQVLGIRPNGQTRVIARGLSSPTGLAWGPNGILFVSEAGSGRVISIENGQIEVLIKGLSQPHGLVVLGLHLFALDRDARALHRFDLQTQQSIVVAQNLPTGAGTGRRINTLPGIADLMPGPLSGFADLAALPDGRLCIGCDGDGSIRTFRPSTAH